MSEIPNEPVYSRNVLEMLAVANEYCLFVEKAGEYNLETVNEIILKIAPLLYLKGMLLPQVEVSDESFRERFVTEEQYEDIFNQLRSRLQDADEFWFMENDGKVNGDPVRGSLAEHLADIYQDMKDFVMLYQKNTRAAKENAVADCRRLFLEHWGIRVIRSIKILHFHRFGDPEAPDYDFIDG